MELDLRGTGIWWIKKYLGDIGGVETAPDLIEGPGWSAALTEGVHRAFRFEVPRVIVRFSGEPAAVAEAYRKLRLMAFRGGG